MASNFNRKSGSSGSRRAGGQRTGSRGRASGASQAPYAGPGRPASSRASRPSQPRVPQMPPYRAIPGGRAPSSGRAHPQGRPSSQRSSSAPYVSSVRVGDLDRAERRAQAERVHRRSLIKLGVAAAFVLALVGGGIALYYSSLFTIETVSVQGVEHLTATEMTELAAVPSGTTLLRVDAAGIKQRLLADAWVKDVSVNRIFPNTLELAITERTIAAVVEVPTENAEATREWAIASDGMWLMPIPERTSEAGRSISQKIYEDADAALHIVDVPFGTAAEIGTYCTDENVNNALAIVDGMTTSLADQVTTVRATDAESTTLTLESGIEIAFGPAEDIREKERVCLELMEQNPGSIAYINVRVVDRPTWRSL